MRYRIVDDFLNGQECQKLIEMATPRLEPSTSWNVETGSMQITDYRISDQCFFRRGETPLIADIEQRIANITNTKVEQGEGCQCLRYGVGGTYKSHFDYFDVNFEGNRSQLNRGGQRILTCMCYLQAPIRGGTTYFPRLGSEQLRGHKFTPVTGRLIIWWNVDPDGIQDETTIHSGEPVEEGTKWILNKWIRAGSFL